MSDIMIPQSGAVFGDLTIVHNINFNGQSNPIQMMAMQQQNMMLAAAAVNMQKIAIQQMNAAITQREQITLENKINQMKQLGLNDTEKESLKIAASNNDILNEVLLLYQFLINDKFLFQPEKVFGIKMFFLRSLLSLYKFQAVLPTRPESKDKSHTALWFVSFLFISFHENIYIIN